MNISAEKVMSGIIDYADHEVINKLPTSGKWIMGTAIGLMSNRIENAIEVFRDNAIMKALGIIDENGDIDVDALNVAMKDSAERYGNLTVEVPMIGRLTFSAQDIDKLRGYME